MRSLLAAAGFAMLAAHAAGPERARFWTERLEACWAHVTGGSHTGAAE